MQGILDRCSSQNCREVALKETERHARGSLLSAQGEKLPAARLAEIPGNSCGFLWWEVKARIVLCVDPPLDPPGEKGSRDHRSKDR